MVEDPEALLVGDKWTEAGFESIQGIMGVCKRLGQKRAESEHLAISLLRDERTMASRVVQKAGGDSKALLAGFEAYAATQPQQRGEPVEPFAGPPRPRQRPRRQACRPGGGGGRRKSRSYSRQSSGRAASS